MKICGLRDAESIAAAVDAGADAVGFVFAESVRSIEPAAARRLAGAVPEGVLKVAVCKQPGNAHWQRVAEEFRPDVLQTDAADFEELDVDEGIERWPVVREGQDEPPATGRFLYEGVKSGTGQPVDWSRARQIGAGREMILAGGLAPGNVAAAIHAASPWGVDVSSGVESRRGVKDPEKIRAFINAARAATGKE